MKGSTTEGVLRYDDVSWREANESELELQLPEQPPGNWKEASLWSIKD